MKISISELKIKNIFIYITLLWIILLIVRQAPHSEGVPMISEWGKPILGIDFEKQKFLYVEDGIRETKISESISLVKRDFFPYLTLKNDGREITFLWKEYHTPIFTTIAKKIVRKIVSSERVSLSLINFVLLNMYIILIIFLTNKMLKKNFKSPPTGYSLLFFFTASSTLSLLWQYHHIQTTLFLLVFIYFMEKKKYIPSALFGGLTLYSYLPSVFAVSGVSLYHFIKERNRRWKIAVVFLISLIFTIPSLTYIITSKGEDYRRIYGCSDCLVFFPPEGLKRKLGEAGEKELLDVIHITIGKVAEFFSPPKIFDNLWFALSNAKESFSFSDIAKRYGLISSPPPLKWLSDLAIWVHIILLLIGVFYVKKKPEFWVFTISLLVYTFMSSIFVMIPKMLYFFLPIYSVFATKVFFAFRETNKKIALLFLISAVLRVVDIIGISEKFPPYLRWDKNKEVAEFVQKHNLDVIQYSLPIAFKFFTDGKINPPFLALIFEKLKPEEIEKIGGFLAQKLSEEGKALIIDTRMGDEIKKGAEKKGYKTKILFKNQGFVVIKFERNTSQENQNK